MSDPCKFCSRGSENVSMLDGLTHLLSTDIRVRIVHGIIMRCEHYDSEGDAIDDRADIPIKFCPMCGRNIHEDAVF